MLNQSAQRGLALLPAAYHGVLGEPFPSVSRRQPPRAPTAIWLNASALPAEDVLRGAGLTALHVSSRCNGSPLLLHHVAEEAWLAVLDLAEGTVAIFDLAQGWQDEMEGAFDRLYLNLPRRVLGEARLREVPRPGPVDAVALALGTALAARPMGPQLDSLLVALQAHLAKAYAPVPPASANRGGLAPWQLRKAKAMIEARIESGVCVEEIARECRLSRSYFSRAFKHSTGVAPHAWLAERRVEKAKLLLAKEDLRIADVAAECGFADQSHLTRSFSARLGITPAAWRRQAQSGEIQSGEIQSGEIHPSEARAAA